MEAVTKAADGASWDFAEIQNWISQNYNLQLLEITFGEGGTIYPLAVPILCIITGISPRDCRTGRHAVVAETCGLDGFIIVHDPHPSGDGLVGDPTHACFLIPTTAIR